MGLPEEVFVLFHPHLSCKVPEEDESIPFLGSEFISSECVAGTCSFVS